MDDTRNTRNYAAHGGNEWVIGGKLIFLPGATVEGAETLFGAIPSETIKPPVVPDSKATSASALREDFNNLLAVLRSVGILATEESASNMQPSENAKEQDDGK